MNMAIEKLTKDGIYAISVLFNESNLDFYKKFNFHIMMAGQMETRKPDEAVYALPLIGGYGLHKTPVWLTPFVVMNIYLIKRNIYNKNVPEE
jgi:predicted N-acetyltransferase YhbS